MCELQDAVSPPGDVPTKHSVTGSDGIQDGSGMGEEPQACSLAHVPVNVEEYPRFKDTPWMSSYAPWRHRCEVSFDEWRAAIPAPIPIRERREVIMSKPEDIRHAEFAQCLRKQAKAFADHVLEYKSPRLSEVRDRVKGLKAETGYSVTAVVFWGRRRYVVILAQYLERNLVANGGVVDKILLLTGAPVHQSDAGSTRDIIQSLQDKYPGSVSEVSMCKDIFGCAFNEILTDDRTVYVKLDDDTLFIKDGTFEHLVYENLGNAGYLFYAPNIVNHNFGNGVQRFAGAYPPESFHWPVLGYNNNSVPLFDEEDVVGMLWGSQADNFRASQAHEAFITNVAMGRLDVYTYDHWNMHECIGARPQAGIFPIHSEDGNNRWSINAMAWMRSRVAAYPAMPPDDEPTISIRWPAKLAPHRVGFVGEALVVHHALWTQRDREPKHGFVEEWVLPVYSELARQYTSVGFGEWRGNMGLLALFEETLEGLGHRRHSEDPALFCKEVSSDMRWSEPHCEQFEKARVFVPRAGDVRTEGSVSGGTVEQAGVSEAETNQVWVFVGR